MNRQKTVTLLSAVAAIGASAGIAGAVSKSSTTKSGSTTLQSGSYDGSGQYPGDGPGRRGPGGPGGGRGFHREHRPLTDAQLTKIAGKLGITADALKAAIKKTEPAKPTKDQPGKPPRDGDGRGPQGFAEDLATALGVDAADVQKILEANRPAPPTTPPAPGTKPTPPDPSALITALATGLNKSEADVQAAFDKLRADHQADHADGHGPGDRFKALAAELKLSQADVQAAFDSVLGAPKLKSLKKTK